MINSFLILWVYEEDVPSPIPRDQITLDNLISSWDKMPDDGKNISKAS